MPKTLLVVDDSATMRKVFEMTFAGEDVTVVTHDGGDSLLARARDAKPALAIVDVALGGTSGYDVARSLKGDASLGGVPVLMLYSEHSPLDEGRARDAGADGSLLKPFDTQAAIDKVKQFLAQPGAGAGTVASTTVSPAPVGMTRAIPGTTAGGPPAPSPPAPAVRSPASAGIGSVGAQPPAASRPKATQMFASSPLAAPPGPSAPAPGVPARPPFGNAPPGRPMPSPPTASRQPAPDIEIEVDGGDEELTLEPPTPIAPVARPPSPAGPPPGMPPVSTTAPAPSRVAPPGPPVVAPPSAGAVTSAPVPPTAASTAQSAASAQSVAISAEVGQRVAAMGLTPAQVDAVTALTREVVERVVWEVVPQLAETLIREELRRLTAD